MLLESPGAGRVDSYGGQRFALAPWPAGWFFLAARDLLDAPAFPIWVKAKESGALAAILGARPS